MHLINGPCRLFIGPGLGSDQYPELILYCNCQLRKGSESESAEGERRGENTK